MDIPINKNMTDLLILFIFIFLPLILILIGATTGFLNALFYIFTITWFGMGMIFYKAIYTS